MRCELGDAALDKWIGEAVMGLEAVECNEDKESKYYGWTFKSKENYPDQVRGFVFRPTHSLDDVAKAEVRMKIKPQQYISALKKTVLKKGQYAASEIQVITATARERASAIWLCHA